jgi:hypothetical protein
MLPVLPSRLASLTSLISSSYAREVGALRPGAAGGRVAAVAVRTGFRRLSVAVAGMDSP